MNCQLKDLGEIITGNTPSKKENSYYETKDIPFIKPDVLADNELIIKTPSDYLSEKARNKARIVNKGSILVTCIGSIGKIGVCQGECAFNQQINTIVPNDKVRSDYLAYNLIYNKQRLIDIANCSVVPIINKKQFSEFSIKVDLNKETQQKIVAKLDNLNLAIDKCKRLLELHDELIKSKFYEMFGDPYFNSKNWVTKSFLELGDCKNGMNFNSNESGIRIRYVGIGEFQNKIYISDNDYLPTVSLNKFPSDDYLLKNEDILFVRSNGSKDLVGRSIIVYPNSEQITYSGFCIRWRKKTDIILTKFLIYLLKHDSTKAKLVGNSRGSNIQNINQKMLQKLDIIIPPLSLQTQFAQYVETVESSKTKIKDLQSRIEYLKASYMQEFFA